ncbi:MAG: AAA family ATPase [Anaerolineales bacterium]
MHLHLLGSPALQTDDSHPIEFDTRKALAVLAYLAMHDQPFQRDTLAALFWPELDQSRARAALRRTLTPLNHALGDALVITRDTLALNPAFHLWVDARAFEAAAKPSAEIETLQNAAALYKGDFMAGFTLRDAPEFDNWQFFESDRLRRLYASTLERLIPLLTARGNHAPALEHARAWLALDPLHEPAHRTLMRLYAQTDQRAAALRQYRECVRILDEELGVPPLEETKQLYEEILENRLLVDQLIRDQLIGDRPTSQPANQSTDQPVNRSLITNLQLPITPSFPLTGRTSELTTLLTTHTRPSPDGYFIGIEGEAGIGKTRLVEEFLAQAQAKGTLTLTARCYRNEEQLAYSPFIEGLRAFLTRPDAPARLAALPLHYLTEATRLLPEITNYQLPITDPQSLITNLQSPITSSQPRLFESLRQIIFALLRGPHPGILFLDDLQWADSASLELLLYLVRRLQDYPLLFLAAWRNEDTTRLETLVTETQRAGQGTKITLNRLTRAEVTHLASTVTALPAEKLQTLYAETEGLPFFVIEYLQNPDWDSQQGTLPNVRNLERARLAGLDETARQILTTAAVIGRSFDFDTLREASGRSEEETITGLETLLARGLLLEHKSSSVIRIPSPVPLSYDFTHEKIRTVVYEDTTLIRRRLLHRRIAQSLISQLPITKLPIPSSPARIAHHLHFAGQHAEAARYYQQAGDAARHIYANAESLSHYQTALALGHPEPCALHEAIGDLQTLQGDYRHAVASYETAAALSSRDSLARIEHKLANLHHRRGDYDLAASFFQSALDATQSPSLRAHLLADFSRTCAQQGDHARAVQLAEEALSLATSPLPQGEESGVRAQAHNVLGMAARQTGDLPRAVHHLQQALAMADQTAHLPAQIAALNNLALAYEDQHDYPRAVELAQTALDLCTRLGDRHREAALRNRLADLFHASDQPTAAMYHLKKAVEIFAEIGGSPGAYEPEIWKLTEW